MDTKKLVMIIILGIIGISLVFGLANIGEYEGNVKYSDNSGVVGIIYIDGPISGSASSGFASSGTHPEVIMNYLRDAQYDDNVKAVVLRMNTPGGTTAASQEIAMEVARLREKGKVVVTSMGDMAASGGYWIAAESDWIVATPGTITGSIGVIMEIANLQELYGKIGVDFEVIKSGEYKDIGSSNRDMTETEQAMLQAMVDDLYYQFVEVVSLGRNMSESEVLAIADGRIFTGREALNVGLVDELGNFYDAIDAAVELAGLEDYYIYEYGVDFTFKQLFSQIFRFELDIQKSIKDMLISENPVNIR